MSRGIRDPGSSQAAQTHPLGRIRPPSSNRTTPLHRRHQPCSGWADTTCAAQRSEAEAEGHFGSWLHITGLQVHYVQCNYYHRLERSQYPWLLSIRLGVRVRSRRPDSGMPPNVVSPRMRKPRTGLWSASVTDLHPAPGAFETQAALHPDHFQYCNRQDSTAEGGDPLRGSLDVSGA